MFHPRSTLRSTVTWLVAITAIGLTGCGTSSSNGTTSTSEGARAYDAGPAATSVNALVDASSAALFAPPTSSAISARSTGPGHGGDGGDDRPDLAGANGSHARHLDLDDIHEVDDGDGNPIRYLREHCGFTAVSGSVTIASTGTSVTSAPLGTTIQWTGSVTVTLTAVDLTTRGGDHIVIPSGQLTYDLEVMLEDTSPGTTTGATAITRSWLLTSDRTTRIPGGTPIAGTYTPAGSVSGVAFSLVGTRHVLDTTTRQLGIQLNESAPFITTLSNQMTRRRQIDGPVLGSDIPSASADSAKTFTSWRLTIANRFGNEWNRNGDVTASWNFRLPGNQRRSVTVASDVVYLRFSDSELPLLNRVLGPYTARQAAELVRGGLDEDLL